MFWMMFFSWSATMIFCIQLARYHGIFNWSATTCNRDSRCIKLHERAQAKFFLALMARALVVDYLSYGNYVLDGIFMVHLSFGEIYLSD